MKNLTETAIEALEITDKITLYHDDNVNIFKKIKDESIDVILTDPPYLYLKNQKLEREFDEEHFFSECKRVLTKDGFLVFFGRGTSFYRWNTIADSLGFKFKEEIIWDKMRTSSPVTPIGRKHETIAIYAKDTGAINKVKTSVFDVYRFEPHKIQRIIERLNTVFGNRESFELLKKYYETGYQEFHISEESKFNATRSRNSNINQNRTIQFAVGLEEGILEQSIMTISRDHYNTIYPTQKNANLLRRLLRLVIPQDKPKSDIVVFDPFGGSFSTMEAVHNMGMKGISCEIDKEYFEAGYERIKEITRQLKMF